MENLNNPQEQYANWKAPETGSQEQNIDQPKVEDKIVPPETETPQSPVEPEESRKEQAENPRLAEITEKRKRNQALADEMRISVGRIKNIVDSVTPREPWFRHLAQFKDHHISSLSGQVRFIEESIDDLNRVGNLFENNDPSAESQYQEITDQLVLDWQSFSKMMEDATESNDRLRRQTAELLQRRLDDDNPIINIGRQLRRATEEYESNSRRL